jgi:iron complex transport system ATP-binding protein
VKPIYFNESRQILKTAAFSQPLQGGENAHANCDRIGLTDSVNNENLRNEAGTIENQEAEFLELRQVDVARGERVVLHDVSMAIRAGEHVAILGPNGCGKSTLILVMTCQIYPMVRPGMVVRIFGRERWDLTELRKHFGVVGTDLPGGRTAVTTGLDAVIAGFFSASTLWPNLHVTPEMRERAHEALERMEALDLEDRLVGEMSAGEKRRILIARALVHRPRQLLLDEPSNALDLAAQRELRETLRRLAQEGTGLVLVTHYLGDILPEIKRVILMRSGRIVGDGPREELLTEARLSALFRTPVRIGRDEEWLHSW